MMVEIPWPQPLGVPKHGLIKRDVSYHPKGVNQRQQEPEVSTDNICCGKVLIDVDGDGDWKLWINNEEVIILSDEQ